MSDYYSNLSAAWAKCSSADLDMGQRAYPTYRATLRSMAEFYAAPFVATVEAFVAMSPNSDYHGNLRSLASLLCARRDGRGFDSCIISTYRAAGERAWGYLSGEVSFADTVRGRKITSFRHNILYPDTSPFVTVDGHMIALGFGEDFTMSEANFKLRQRGVYDGIEEATQRIARRAGLSPCEAQAALWTWRKRSKGIKFDAQMDLFTGATLWDRPLTAEEILPYGKSVNLSSPG